MFKSFWGSQEQQESPNAQSVSSAHSSQRTSDLSSSSSHRQFSPTEAADIISSLKDKSDNELRKLLNDKNAYNAFLSSLDQVKIQNNLKDELQKETRQLARENLEKEPCMVELRNQCRIIRMSELATAQERLGELERRKDELLKLYSPSMLLQKLQEAMNKTEDESEALHKQFVGKEIDLATFVQKYKNLRTSYHQRAVLHLAAKTSV